MMNSPIEINGISPEQVKTVWIPADRLYSRNIIQSLISSQEAGLLLTEAVVLYLLWFLHNHSLSSVFGG